MTKRVLVAIATIALIFVAQATRYEPLAGTNAFQFIPVWDRWLHRICVVSLSLKNKMACSTEELTAVAEALETPKEKTIRILRQGGFLMQR